MKRRANARDELKLEKRTCSLLALFAASAIALPAQTFTTLHAFEDGASPSMALVQATSIT
jgi:hypothetical protein